jgi:hypothetical protein
VVAASLTLIDEGAVLLPSRGRARYAEPAGDVAAFGAVLYEMIAGAKPTAEGSARVPAARDGEEEIQTAAMRLASRCIGSVSNSREEIQTVLSELRLLGVQVKLKEMEGGPAPPAMASPQPVVTPDEAAPEPAPARKGRTREPAVYTPIAPEDFFAVAGTEEVDPAPSGVKCPKCGVPYVYPSRTRSWVEGILASFNSSPMRCHRCLHRYVTIFGRIHFEKGSPKLHRASPRLGGAKSG